MGQGETRYNLSVTPEAYIGDWDVYKANLSSLPGGFDLSNVEEYGFQNLNKGDQYSFDFVNSQLTLGEIIGASGFSEIVDAGIEAKAEANLGASSISGVMCAFGMNIRIISTRNTMGMIRNRENRVMHSFLGDSVLDFIGIPMKLCILP